MTNPSYEYMRRIRREEQAKLLGLRRERAVKALRSLDLHGGSHAMLSQIAYAIHPHVGAWDEGACLHLRNVLIELIGGAREAAPDAQSRCAYGTGGCDRGDESKEVNDGMAGGSRGMREVHGNSSFDNMATSHAHKELDFGYYDVLGNERHKAVCELSGISVDKLVENYDYVDIYPEFIWALGQAIGLRRGAGFEAIVNRLIHLLCGDLSHDTNPMRQENETGITDELQVKLGELQAECDRLTAALDELHADPANDAICRLERERDELCAERANLLNLLRDARDEYKMLDRMSAETSANFHAMRDRVWGLEAERDELQARLDEISTQNGMLRDKLDELSTSGATELYKLLKRTVGDAKQIADKLNAHNGMLKESERLRRENAECAADAINKACMYLDLLRDAAMDYKELQDRLNLVFGMWVNATNGGTHE